MHLFLDGTWQASRSLRYSAVGTGTTGVRACRDPPSARPRDRAPAAAVATRRSSLWSLSASARRRCAHAARLPNGVGKSSMRKPRSAMRRAGPSRVRTQACQRFHSSGRWRTAAPRAAACSLIAVANAVLPIPASPLINSSPPCPAEWRASTSRWPRASSASRPTSPDVPAGAPVMRAAIVAPGTR